MEEQPRFIRNEPASLPLPKIRIRKIRGINYAVEDMTDFLQRFAESVFEHQADPDPLPAFLHHLLETSNVQRSLVFFAIELMQQWLWYNAATPVPFATLAAAFTVALKFAKDFRDNTEYELADWAYCMGIDLKELFPIATKFNKLQAEYMSDREIKLVSGHWKREWHFFITSRHDERRSHAKRETGKGNSKEQIAELKTHQARAEDEQGQ